MKKIQARYYNNGRIQPIRPIVMHSMKSPETPTTAEDLAHWFATSSPGTSAHVCVDQNSAVRCVDDGEAGITTSAPRDQRCGDPAPGAATHGHRLQETRPTRARLHAGYSGPAYMPYVADKITSL